MWNLTVDNVIWKQCSLLSDHTPRRQFCTLWPFWNPLVMKGSISSAQIPQSCVGLLGVYQTHFSMSKDTKPNLKADSTRHHGESSNVKVFIPWILTSIPLLTWFYWLTTALFRNVHLNVHLSTYTVRLKSTKSEKKSGPCTEVFSLAHFQHACFFIWVSGYSVLFSNNPLPLKSTAATVCCCSTKLGGFMRHLKVAVKKKKHITW